jgi:putative tryptophan/tyrosine transport system substrate-binding protein
LSAFIFFERRDNVLHPADFEGKHFNGMHSGSPEQYANLMTAFRKGLSETGYVEGQNVAIEFRWAAGQDDRLPELAADLIRRQVAVIATPGSTSAALAAKAATTMIPVVFTTSGDPVALGLVASINRPGGNATGIIGLTVETTAKRLGLLRELVPQVARFVALVNPNSSLTEVMVKDLGASGRELPVEILYAGTNLEIDAVFAQLVQKPGGALLVQSRPVFSQPSCATRHAGGAPRGARDLSGARICRHRRPDELRAELCEHS